MSPRSASARSHQRTASAPPPDIDASVAAASRRSARSPGSAVKSAARAQVRAAASRPARCRAACGGLHADAPASSSSGGSPASARYQTARSGGAWRARPSRTLRRRAWDVRAAIRGRSRPWRRLTSSPSRWTSRRRSAGARSSPPMPRSRKTGSSCTRHGVRLCASTASAVRLASGRASIAADHVRSSAEPGGRAGAAASSGTRRSGPAARAISTTASGLPAHRSTIVSTTRGDARTGSASTSARLSSAERGPSSTVGSRQIAGSTGTSERTDRSSAIRSGPRRRATNIRTCWDGASIHGKSSTTSSSGSASAAEAKVPRAAAHTASGLPTVPARSARAISSASRWTSGRPSMCLSSGISRSATAANGSTASLSTPAVRRTRRDDAPTTSSSSVDFPLPGSPARTVTVPSVRRGSAATASSARSRATTDDLDRRSVGHAHAPPTWWGPFSRGGGPSSSAVRCNNYPAKWKAWPANVQSRGVARSNRSSSSSVSRVSTARDRPPPDLGGLRVGRVEQVGPAHLQELLQPPGPVRLLRAAVRLGGLVDHRGEAVRVGPGAVLDRRVQEDQLPQGGGHADPARLRHGRVEVQPPVDVVLGPVEPGVGLRRLPPRGGEPLETRRVAPVASGGHGGVDGGQGRQVRGQRGRVPAGRLLVPAHDQQQVVRAAGEARPSRRDAPTVADVLGRRVGQLRGGVLEGAGDGLRGAQAARVGEIGDAGDVRRGTSRRCIPRRCTPRWPGLLTPREDRAADQPAAHQSAEDQEAAPVHRFIVAAGPPPRSTAAGPRRPIRGRAAPAPPARSPRRCAPGGCRARRACAASASPAGCPPAR